MEHQYNKEIKSLCRTPCFSAVIEETSLHIVDRSFLNNVMHLVNKKTSLLGNLVFNIGSSNFRSSLANPRTMTMKFVTILVILCRSAHQNNSNYIFLLITLYIYLASTCINTITLLNYLVLSVSYTVYQR